MTPMRCAVCLRILGMTEGPAPQTVVYCPDRLCYLYPTTTSSRSEDPTLPAWVMGMHATPTVTDAAVARALGRGHNWVNSIVERQRKRWRKAY